MLRKQIALLIVIPVFWCFTFLVGSAKEVDLSNGWTAETEKLTVFDELAVDNSIIKSSASSVSAKLSLVFENEENNFDDEFLQKIFDLTNKERQDHNLKPLKINSLLNKAAQLKAEDMVKNNYFDHYSPQGISPWHWIEKAGYHYATAGENLAVDYQTPEAVVKAWLLSASHRANILNEKYTEIGLAKIYGPYKNHQALMIVQIFAKPNHEVGDEFSVFLKIQSDSQNNINAVGANLTYSTDTLYLKSIDFSHSPFPIYFKEINPAQGSIEIAVVKPNGGLEDESEVARLNFKVIASGPLEINWAGNPLVLANDGQMINNVRAL